MSKVMVDTISNRSGIAALRVQLAAQTEEITEPTHQPERGSDIGWGVRRAIRSTLMFVHAVEHAWTSRLHFYDAIGYPVAHEQFEVYSDWREEGVHFTT